MPSLSNFFLYVAREFVALLVTKQTFLSAKSVREVFPDVGRVTHSCFVGDGEPPVRRR